MSPLTRAQMLENERKWEERHRVTNNAIEATADRQVPWAVEAMRAVVTAAGYNDDVTTDDVWMWLDHWKVPRPSEPRAMGAVMRKAVADGVLRITDRVRQSLRDKTAEGTTHHTAPIRIYRSLVHD